MVSTISGLASTVSGLSHTLLAPGGSHPDFGIEVGLDHRYYVAKECRRKSFGIDRLTRPWVFGNFRCAAESRSVGVGLTMIYPAGIFTDFGT